MPTTYCACHASPNPFTSRTLAEFDEKFSPPQKENTHYFDDKDYPDCKCLSCCANEYHPLIKDLLRSALNAQREEIREKILKIIGEFNPTCGYESEEEKGFQKGIIAEQNLIKFKVSTLLSLNNKEI